MSWQDWKKRLGLDGQVSSAHFVMPTVVLELEPGFVVGARLDGGSRQVQGVGIRQLEAGALAPSLSKANVMSETVVHQTVAEVAGLVGSGGERLGLLIPDVAVRVAVLQFEGLPESDREAEALVRWRMREFLPFPPEEARVSFQVLVKQPRLVEILGMAVRSSVLAEYEAVVESINGGPALILPARVALLPLLPADMDGQLLLHLCPGALTAAVVESDRVRLWRTRVLEDAAGAENLEEVAREAARIVATCQDQLGVRVQNVWFCARPPARNEMRETLAKTLGCELRPLPGDFAQSTTLDGDERETFQHFGMPFAGLMANRNEPR
jgi:hypothetical protein